MFPRFNRNLPFPLITHTLKFVFYFPFIFFFLFPLPTFPAVTQVPCVFPFIYLGASYSSCTSIGRNAVSISFFFLNIQRTKIKIKIKIIQPWCSLTSNYDQDGVWGYCNSCATTCNSPCTEDLGNRNIPSCYEGTSSWAYCNPYQSYIPTTAPYSAGPTTTLSPTNANTGDLLPSSFFFPSPSPPSFQHAENQRK